MKSFENMPPNESDTIAWVNWINRISRSVRGPRRHWPVPVGYSAPPGRAHTDHDPKVKEKKKKNHAFQKWEDLIQRSLSSSYMNEENFCMTILSESKIYESSVLIFYSHLVPLILAWDTWDFLYRIRRNPDFLKFQNYTEIIKLTSQKKKKKDRKLVKRRFRRYNWE